MRLVLDAGGVSIVVNESGVLRDRRCLTAGKASAAAFFSSIHTSASKPNAAIDRGADGFTVADVAMRWGLMRTGTNSDWSQKESQPMAKNQRKIGRTSRKAFSHPKLGPHGCELRLCLTSCAEPAQFSETKV